MKPINPMKLVVTTSTTLITFAVLINSTAQALEFNLARGIIFASHTVILLLPLFAVATIPLLSGLWFTIDQRRELSLALLTSFFVGYAMLQVFILRGRSLHWVAYPLMLLLTYLLYGELSPVLSLIMAIPLMLITSDLYELYIIVLDHTHPSIINFAAWIALAMGCMARTYQVRKRKRNLLLVMTSIAVSNVLIYLEAKLNFTIMLGPLSWIAATFLLTSCKLLVFYSLVTTFVPLVQTFIYP